MTPTVRIVVLDGFTLNPGDNPWDSLAGLGDLTVYDRTRPDEVVARASAADIILTNKTPITAASIAQLPNLRFVSVLATGYNVVDLDAARRRRIPVSNVPEYGTDSVAQHTFALILELCQRVSDRHAAVVAGEWIAAPDFCFWRTPPIELAGLTMGIVGFGRIGQRVGELAHAFGMNVIAAGGSRRSDPGYQPFAWRETADLFLEADVVSLHCPLTADNAGFVNDAVLRRMKPTGFLINTARGALVNETDLAAALHAGRLAGAAVDVLSIEPMRADNPLRTAPRCLITPHIAWATLAARRRLMSATVENIEAFFRGQPIHVVN